MKKFHNALLILTLGVGSILFPSLSQAQEIRVSARLDSTQILIGDQVNVTLEVQKPADIALQFPETAENLSEYIEVLKSSPIDTLIENNVVKLTRNLLVTSFDSGEHRIPPFWFRIDLGDRIDSIATNELSLRVYTMEIDTSKGPTDIKMPYDAPLTLKEVTPWIMGVILVAAIIFFIFYYLSRRKRNLPLFTMPPKPKEPAHIVALRNLDRIKDEKLWQKDKIKEYYSQVTDVLRIYIEERYTIPAMEQTTDEILASFGRQKDKPGVKTLENLRQVLTLADLVKFAKYLPLPDDHNLTLVNSYFFVNETRPADIPEVKKPEKGNDEDGVEVPLK